MYINNFLIAGQQGAMRNIRERMYIRRGKGGVRRMGDVISVIWADCAS